VGVEYGLRVFGGPHRPQLAWGRRFAPELVEDRDRVDVSFRESPGDDVDFRQLRKPLPAPRRRTGTW
jgi:hypothetical protein